MGRYCLFCVYTVHIFRVLNGFSLGIEHHQRETKKKWHERFDANKVSLISCAFSVHVWQNNVLKRISSTIIEGVFVAIKHRQ